MCSCKQQLHKPHNSIRIAVKKPFYKKCVHNLINIKDNIQQFKSCKTSSVLK